MRPLLLASSLLVCACAGEVGPPMGDPGAPTAEASARVVAFALPMRMVGTEPFWGGLIDDAGITLSGADRPELRFPAGERVVTGAGARWRTRSADGRTLDLTLLRETCSDGMSDRSYPFQATAVVGSETLRGCAMTEAEFMRRP